MSLGRRLNNREDAKKPQILSEIKDIMIVDISAGRDHVLALDKDKFI